ncbi:hydroxyisourate hydrolase [Rhodococcus sp. ARC_M6]|uniref:hydroxyisourate hydrolase n=1 Tax=Rhodococcus sp. ARC_M6 TaxID=2928852 RepID=UPI001FB1B131|nr:hydroxyisourate hydrolase [Rhodococcus sp. ARC_M6]MCJ0903618.1 hydroxyisourate hydrolase [Rhodococcus sp. ARC_M6]
MSKVLSTHVLDSTTGKPAAGVGVQLCVADGAPISRGYTDSDGRIAELAPDGLTPGNYHLIFDTGAYFEQTGQENFYPEVSVTFRINDTARGYHVPLLLSPFAYSTYRGS